MMRSSLMAMVVALAAVLAACGGGDEEQVTQPTVDWAGDVCGIFDRYFTATGEAVAGKSIVDGPLDARLEDVRVLAKQQVELLTAAADAFDVLVPGEGKVDEFQGAMGDAFRADVPRMQQFVDAPPETEEDLVTFAGAAVMVGREAIEIMLTSEGLDEAAVRALQGDESCVKWQ